MTGFTALTLFQKGGTFHSLIAQLTNNLIPPYVNIQFKS
ncbi:hypothetical protein P278_07750 [Zhouia amylolytica AD3]|uniref:Uncharacterized protein n=1 Tax=Zhouia amylolytica AD3 TaxID=1286632 RepID=W2UQQ4_9FLAO|nr:hypothetical protein P278_07750 [Zhouia amylolytica AD3]